MKTVLLMRHAEAGQEHAGQVDFDRELTDYGRRTAIETGVALHRLGIRIDRIVASAAVRTQSTARLVAGQAAPDVPIQLNAILYSAPVSRLQHVPAEYGKDSEQCLMFVGHNPGVGELMCLWSARMMSVPPATMVVLEFDVMNWTDIGVAGGTLKWVIKEGEVCVLE